MAVLLIWYIFQGTPTYIMLDQDSMKECNQKLYQFGEDTRNDPRYVIVDAACAVSI